MFGMILLVAATVRIENENLFKVQSATFIGFA